MRNTAKLFILVAATLTGSAWAITPPVVTQPKAGVIRFTWAAPTTRENGAPLAASEIGSYELYLTNEKSVIILPGASTSYDYVIPAGYTTTASDSAAIMATDTTGQQSKASAAVALPAGVTSPKSRPGAVGGLTAVRAPN